MQNKYHSRQMFVFSFAKDVNALKKIRSRGKKNQKTNKPTTQDPEVSGQKKIYQLSFYLVIIVTSVLFP